MSAIALVVAVILVILGVAHFYWAAGGKAGTEKVIPKIDGKPAINPGVIITVMVGVGLVGVGFVIYSDC